MCSIGSGPNFSWTKQIKLKPFMEILNLLNYLTNHCSNEKVSETKVVDLEKLNKNGIQKFFIWGLEKGENLSFVNWIQNFELFTRMPLTASLSPLLSRRPYASDGIPPRCWPRPQFRPWPSPLAARASATRPRPPGRATRHPLCTGAHCRAATSSSPQFQLAQAK